MSLKDKKKAKLIPPDFGVLRASDFYTWQGLQAILGCGEDCARALQRLVPVERRREIGNSRCVFGDDLIAAMRADKSLLPRER